MNHRINPWTSVSVLFLLASVACSEVPEQTNGVVTAASPEAAQAGIEILDAGGNAIDALVAVQFALGVTEPAMSGLGGQTQIVLARSNEETVVINGTSRSPANLPPNPTSSDITGHRATTIPGTVKTLAFAFENFGSGNVTWAEVLAPAIRYADSGFTVGEFRGLVWARHRDDLAADPTTAGLFLLEDGSYPEQGTVFRQPVLAATLRRLADVGADDFYRGEIASQIAADMEANGGWITAADLANVPDPLVIPALRTTYRGYDVASLPPPGGGWVVLQILNLLENANPQNMRSDDAYRQSSVAKALLLGHQSRQNTPIEDLINYHAAAADRLSKSYARQMWDAAPTTSTTDGSDSDGGETTHFSVVDGRGMAASVTASINAYFGSRVATPTLGFLYNDYMHEFELGQPDHPFALKGNAMPYSSMSPTIVSQDGQPVLVLGSPGSARIISAVAQVTHRWIDLEETITNAVGALRLHVVPGDRLYLEGQMAESPGPWVAQSGFNVVIPSTDLMISGRNAYFGGVHAIAFADGRWTGAADPRRDGAALSTGN